MKIKVREGERESVEREMVRISLAASYKPLILVFKKIPPPPSFLMSRP